MGRHEKKTYLETIRQRYKTASKSKKGIILSEFCETCGYNRKYAIRQLNKKPKRRQAKARRGHPRYEKTTLITALKAIWLASEQMCSKKLKAALPEWLPHYEQENELFSDSVRGQFYSLSPATIDRWLAPYREIRATWNKGGEGVKEQTMQVEACLPFPIVGFDCDNGSEFLNWHLIRYFTERQNTKPVQFTRSRPYHKNDNAHVEQKNWTHVRQLLGYQRFDDVRLVAMMNDLYCNEWSLYQNHFSPSMKLKEKIKINSRYQKKYDLPKTPYQRLLGSEHIADEIKAKLKAKHALLNPFVLKRIIDQKVKRILQLVSVTSSMRQRI